MAEQYPKVKLLPMNSTLVAAWAPKFDTSTVSTQQTPLDPTPTAVVSESGRWR